MTGFNESVLGDLRNKLSPKELEDLSCLPRGIVLAKRHYAAVDRLKAKYAKMIVVDGLDALGDYLRYHNWCQQDLLNVFPWKLSLMRRLVLKQLPFILNTEIVRLKYGDIFKSWPLERVNANHLYAPSDLLDWFKKNLRSTVETVMVPLTMFSKNPDEMRYTYRTVRSSHLSECYEQQKARKLREMRLVCWPEIRNLILPEYQDDIGKLYDDKIKYAEIQNCAPRRAKMKAYEVELPGDKIPFFYDAASISSVTRNGYQSSEVSLSSFRDFGWARHDVLPDAAGDGVPVEKSGYTQGLWFGGKETIKDYETGLVEVMTAERFVKLFGESALKQADWRFSKDLCAWTREDAVLGPGLPPKEMGVLLGANVVAPKEKPH